VIVTADDVTAGKPDPEGFLRARDALGLAAPLCVVFEDSPAGVAAAKASITRSTCSGRAQPSLTCTVCMDTDGRMPIFTMHWPR